MALVIIKTHLRVGRSAGTEAVDAATFSQEECFVIEGPGRAGAVVSLSTVKDFPQFLQYAPDFRGFCISIDLFKERLSCSWAHLDFHL